MYCKALTYSNMLEIPEVENNDWEKRTVQYILKNYNKVRKTVRFMGKGLSEYQIDDIMSDVVLYFKDAGDYDIERAYNEVTDTYLSLEGYISVGIKHCIQRYKTEVYGHEKNVVHSTVISEDGEKDIFDTIQDRSSLDEMNNIGYDLGSALKSIRCMRYRYGIDIYMLIYIRLLTKNKSNMYFNILEALGISKRELAETERKLSRETDMQCLVKAICLNESADIISEIEKYVYGCNQLKEAVNMVMNS